MNMPEQPTLLLTGGTGFIGRHLAMPLARVFPDHRRLMVVRGSAAACDQLWRPTSLDLVDSRALEELVEWARPSIVVHLAAESAFGSAALTAESVWRLNFDATFALARAVARYAPECLVLFTSTAQVYGASFLGGPVTELTATAPSTSYAVSKLAAEHVLRDTLSPSNQLIVTRAFNQCGPGQNTSFVLPSFAYQVVRAESGFRSPVVEVGNLEVERDFLHVTDAVEAYIRLLGLGRTSPRVLIANIASGRASKLRDVLDLFCQQAGRPIEVRVDPRRVRSPEPPSMVGDASLLRELTGWVPRFGVDDIVRDLLRYFRAANDAGRSAGPEWAG